MKTPVEHRNHNSMVSKLFRKHQILYSFKWQVYITIGTLHHNIGNFLQSVAVMMIWWRDRKCLSFVGFHLGYKFFVSIWIPTHSFLWVLIIWHTEQQTECWMLFSKVPCPMLMLVFMLQCCKILSKLFTYFISSNIVFQQVYHKLYHVYQLNPYS